MSRENQKTNREELKKGELCEKYYLGLLFKSTKSRSVRRKISLGTKDEEVAKERRELFYDEWEGKHLTWAQSEGAKWNMKVSGCAAIGSKEAMARWRGEDSEHDVEGRYQEWVLPVEVLEDLWAAAQGEE